MALKKAGEKPLTLRQAVEKIETIQNGNESGCANEAGKKLG